MRLAGLSLVVAMIRIESADGSFSAAVSGLCLKKLPKSWLFRKIALSLHPRWQHSAPRAHSFVGQKIFFNPLKLQIMYLDSEKKKEIFGTYGTSSTDTGSAESQIALFSYRIAHLTEHLKANRKDYSTQRALTTLVGKRRSLLNYLKDRDINRYRAIVAKLGLRR